MYQNNNNDSNKYSSRIELPTVGSYEKNPSKLSSYGYNSMQIKNQINNNGTTTALR